MDVGQDLHLVLQHLRRRPGARGAGAMRTTTKATAAAATTTTKALTKIMVVARARWRAGHLELHQAQALKRHRPHVADDGQVRLDRHLSPPDLCHFIAVLHKRLVARKQVLSLLCNPKGSMQRQTQKRWRKAEGATGLEARYLSTNCSRCTTHDRDCIGNVVCESFGLKEQHQQNHLRNQRCHGKKF